MKRLILPLLALLVAVPLGAQQVPADTTGTHVVRRGDTLWDLASQYLSNPFRWTEIFGLNRDVVADPHWIYPAERLRIPGAPGAGVSAGGQGGVAAGIVPLSQGSDRGRTVFFPVPEGVGPGGVLAGSGGADVTVVTEGDYYRAGRLIPEDQVIPVGRLVEVATASAVPITLSPQIQSHTRVYMKLDAARAGQVSVGDVFHLWRQGREIRPYGRMFQSTGVARVVAVDGEVATVEVERLFDAVRLGDVALPVEQFAVPGGVIPRPASGLQGTIVSFAVPQTVYSVEDVAYLDVGTAAGVSEGDEFAVIMPARETSYGTRPEMQVARLQVIRASDRTSAARVVQLQQPALEVGQVVRLVGKMP